MKQNPIVVMDSGIGGLMVLKQLKDLFSCQKFIYLSDCKNVSYGNKSKSRVQFFCKKNLEKIKKYNPKAIVVACNTMSIAGCEVFASCDFAPVFFVQPNVRKMQKLGWGKSLLLCTRLTSKSGAIAPLTNICSQSVMPLDDLASRIELDPFNAYKFLTEEIFEKINSKKYIFLGCTHYLFFADFLKKKFPQKKFFYGTENLVASLSRICAKEQSFCGNTSLSRVIFLGSGSRRVRSIFVKLCQRDGNF